MRFTAIGKLSSVATPTARTPGTCCRDPALKRAPEQVTITGTRPGMTNKPERWRQDTSLANNDHVGGGWLGIKPLDQGRPVGQDGALVQVALVGDLAGIDR